MDLLLATLLFTPGPLSFRRKEKGEGSEVDEEATSILRRTPNGNNALSETNLVTAGVLNHIFFLFFF